MHITQFVFGQDACIYYEISENLKAYLIKLINSNLFCLLDFFSMVRGDSETSKVCYEIGWHLTFRMKVNRDAQDIYDVVIELNANNRQRDILEPGHDPHNAFKDFTYLEDDDFKTVRIFKVGFISV